MRWFTGYLYNHKCKKNAKLNRLILFRFWWHFFLNVNKKILP
jgi:hypothetical protein